jgi:hypothetical protein
MQVADDWEVLSRKPDEAFWMLAILAQLALIIPQMPATFAAAIWTVRQKSTGVVRKLTARSEEEARQKIALGLFDR